MKIKIKEYHIQTPWIYSCSIASQIKRFSLLHVPFHKFIKKVNAGHSNHSYSEISILYLTEKVLFSDLVGKRIFVQKCKIFDSEDQIFVLVFYRRLSFKGEL